MKHAHFWVAVALLIPTISLAGEIAASTISPGRYVSAGSRGTVVIRKNSRAEARFDHAEARFEIESVGSNCHTCSLAGVLRGTTGYEGYADWIVERDSPKCKVSFRQDDGVINVSAVTVEECRSFCGARARFDGIYKTVPTSCSANNQRARRNQFLREYRLRKFREASDKASRLLEECGEFINWVEIDRLRNDLAIAQLHDGKPTACLETLATTIAAASLNENDLNLPPCDHDSYIAVAKATWHNRALCEKANVSR